MDSALTGRTAEPLYNGVFIPGSIESWLHFYNLPYSLTGLAKGLRKQTSKGFRLVSTKQGMSSIRISYGYSVPSCQEEFQSGKKSEFSLRLGGISLGRKSRPLLKIQYKDVL